MRYPNFSEELFFSLPIVGILRNFSLEEVLEAVPAAVEGGIKTIEVTMNTPDAGEQISKLRDRLGDGANLGAGTVTSLSQLQEAVEAGASFIVTPIVSLPIIESCQERSIPVFAGAFTPTEVFQAWKAGAYMVKLFPANRLGAPYIKDLKAPLSDVRILATGGIDPETIREYLEAGADGFGVGSPLFSRSHVNRRDLSWLQRRAELFSKSYQEAVSST